MSGNPPDDGATSAFQLALKAEFHALNRKRCAEEVLAFKKSLYLRSSTLTSLVAHHLRLDPSVCEVEHPRSWLTGSFNVVIPITTGQGSRVAIRCPLPPRLAESRYPGSVHEKLSCEAATYIWMQEHCPSIRIPHLHGFGFPNGHHFIHASQLSLFGRLRLMFRRFISAVFRRPTPSPYVPLSLNPTHTLSSGYMIMEFLEPSDGCMLSAVQPSIMSDPEKTRNLFRSLSQISLALARFPQPRIGSYRFNDDNATISLSNRPWTSEMAILENDGAPRTMARDETYTCVEPYISDLITFHDKRFLEDRTAAFHELDCQKQMFTKSFLRTVAHHFLCQERRYGPFVLQFTDLHQSNIFVDEDGNVTAILDLEWVNSLPVDMLHAPKWLSGQSGDQVAKDSTEYKSIWEVFMKAFEEQEQLTDTLAIEATLGGLTLSSIIRETWSSQRIWLYTCLASTNAMYIIACHRLARVFNFPAMPSTMYPMSLLWCLDAEDVVAAKLKERNDYVAELASVFDEQVPPPQNNPDSDEEQDNAVEMIRYYVDWVAKQKGSW